jgi:hypothetical protein
MNARVRFCTVLVLAAAISLFASIVLQPAVVMAQTVVTSASWNLVPMPRPSLLEPGEKHCLFFSGVTVPAFRVSGSGIAPNPESPEARKRKMFGSMKMSLLSSARALSRRHGSPASTTAAGTGGKLQ